MPLDPAELRPDTTTGMPRYRQIAERIRRAIDDGELGPGEALPSEGAIRDAAGVSMSVVRDAVTMLAGEGLVVKRVGKPTQVAEQRPVRRVASTRYRDELDLALSTMAAGGEHPETSAFVRDHGIAWGEYREDTHFEVDLATPSEVERFGHPKGAKVKVLRRRIVKYARDAAVQLQDSVMPHGKLEGSAVADPERHPWPGGTVAELVALGWITTKVNEELWGRMPRADEREALGIDNQGTPVWQLVRAFQARELVTGKLSREVRPVELSEVVVSAATNVLVFETDLTDIVAKYFDTPPTEQQGETDGD